MNSKEYREFLEAYKNVYEQQIGVPLKDASDRAAKQQLQKMIPKGEKVYTPKSSLQNAHYEPDGDLVDEGLLGSLDKVVRNTAGSIGGTIGKNKGQQTGIPGGGAVGEIIGRNKGTSTYDKLTKPVKDLKLPGLSNSYEPEGELIEDIEERRKQLARASREGIEGFKQRISDRVRANKKRLSKNREREQLKKEIKSELKNEAVGDPISPNSVFKLSDPEVQKNLKSTMTRMGPPPMKTTQPKPKIKAKPTDIPGTSFPF